MAFNGAGVFNRLYSWVQDAINGIKIRADRMDAEDNGFATGLTDCITRDGQSPALANLPMGGFRHTGVQDGQTQTDYATVSQIQGPGPAFAIAAGTAQALTCVLTPAILALTDGMQIKLRALLANTATAPTFIPNGLPAHPITKLGGVALAANDISGPLHELLLTYNAANTRWELQNPSGKNCPTTQFASGFQDTAAQGYQTTGFNLNVSFSVQGILSNLGSGTPTSISCIARTNGVILNDGGTVWNAISLRSKKKNFREIEDSFTIIESHTVQLGHYKTDNDDAQMRPFLFVEDAQKHWPHAVGHAPALIADKDYLNSDGKIIHKEGDVIREAQDTLGYTDYIPLLMKAFQEQIALNRTLTRRIEILERKQS